MAMFAILEYAFDWIFKESFTNIKAGEYSKN